MVCSEERGGNYAIIISKIKERKACYAHDTGKTMPRWDLPALARQEAGSHKDHTDWVLSSRLMWTPAVQVFMHTFMLPWLQLFKPPHDHWPLLSVEPTICTHQHVKECTLSLKSSQALGDNTKQAGRAPWLSLGGKESIIRVSRASKRLLLYTKNSVSIVFLLVCVLEESEKKGFPPHPLGWTQSKCPGIWLVRYLFLLAWSEILRAQLYFPEEQRLQTS